MSSAVTTECLALDLSVLERLCEDLDRSTTHERAMGAVDRARVSFVGDGLLTVNLNATPAPGNGAEWLLQRIWSSDRVSYPVSGRKRKTLTPWTQRLFIDHQVVATEGASDMADVFDDFSVMASLGLQSAINVPIVHDNACVATLNCMSTQPRWSAPQVVLVRLLALLARPWILQEVSRLRRIEALCTDKSTV